MYKYSAVLWFSLTEEDFDIETPFYKQLRFYIIFLFIFDGGLVNISVIGLLFFDSLIIVTLLVLCLDVFGMCLLTMILIIQSVAFTGKRKQRLQRRLLNLMLV